MSTESEARWVDCDAVATVLKERGKVIKSMGRRAESVVTLASYEALYLVERGQLTVQKDDGTVLSSKDIYQLLTIPLTYYWVYSHLKSLGYLVRESSVAAFQVYDPGDKTSPAFNVCVFDYADPIPNLKSIRQLIYDCDGIQLKAAVVSPDGTVLVFDCSEGVEPS